MEYNKYSANTVNKQILVKGYKTIKDDSGIRVRVNGDSVEYVKSNNLSDIFKFCLVLR